MEPRQEMPEEAGVERSVSFSGVLGLPSHTTTDQTDQTDHIKQQVDAAVEKNNNEEIRKLISSGSTDLQTAVMLALERVSICHQDI